MLFNDTYVYNVSIVTHLQKHTPPLRITVNIVKIKAMLFGLQRQITSLETVLLNWKIFLYFLSYQKTFVNWSCSNFIRILCQIAPTTGNDIDYHNPFQIRATHKYYPVVTVYSVPPCTENHPNNTYFGQSDCTRRRALLLRRRLLICFQ